MLFHSLEFLFVFLPITWIVFFLFIRMDRLRGARGWLTIASLIFYGWWNPPYVVLIGASVLANFWIGKWCCPETSGIGAGGRKALFYLGLALNLGALGYFKYANFFVENINSVLGVSFNFGKVILPLAISFFTFQQIVYIIDAYRGGNRRYSFAEYAFFVLFFPHLIAGPIVHHYELLPQIARERWKPVRWENLQVGLTIFAIGLFKKMVLADGCGEYASPLFNAAAGGTVLATPTAWLGAIAYTLQLYFDFSGYSDMAIGLARLFGIRLPINFSSPYRSSSMIEFWRRWHITLSRFLRDYVYIPLGGSRKGVVLRYSNLLITMLVGGLWHGAGWTFIAWGAIHGVCLIINHLFRAMTDGFFKARPKAVKIFTPFAWALTMLAVIVSWVFFRSPDFGTAANILGSMFPFQSVESSVVTPQLKLLLNDDVFFYWLLIVSGIALLAPSTQQYLRNYDPTLDPPPGGGGRIIPAWRPSAIHGIILGVMIFMTIRRYFSLTPTEFIYFNF
jgi:D-alanyl-lipoteichoic acid acyltransferase DltB (MBOAT superfamily)